MNRRLRVAGALLALIALSAYFAESVVAVACLPGMDHDALVLEGAAHGSMHHDAPANTGPADDSRGDAPRCPLGMAGGGSCVALILPVAVSVDRPGAADPETALPLIEDTHDLLLVAAHFRPPRA
jgi:hypothetical protein